jgi:hypothetical protein
MALFYTPNVFSSSSIYEPLLRSSSNFDLIISVLYLPPLPPSISSPQLWSSSNYADHHHHIRITPPVFIWDCVNNSACWLRIVKFKFGCLLRIEGTNPLVHWRLLEYNSACSLGDCEIKFRLFIGYCANLIFSLSRLKRKKIEREYVWAPYFKSILQVSIFYVK